MEIIQSPLKDCIIIKTSKFGDDRGFFLESYNQRKFKEQGIDFEVKQINFAKSTKNVLRGLHFQKEPYAQAKLVGVVSGSVLDIAVDLRKDSPTYLQSFKIVLSEPNEFFLIPRGFAHGYYTLEDHTIFHYAVDNFYSPEHEGGLRYDDPVINIDWGFTDTPIISNKDLQQPYLKL